MFFYDIQKVIKDDQNHDPQIVFIVEINEEDSKQSPVLWPSKFRNKTFQEAHNFFYKKYLNKDNKQLKEEEKK